MLSEPALLYYCLLFNKLNKFLTFILYLNESCCNFWHCLLYSCCSLAIIVPSLSWRVAKKELRNFILVCCQNQRRETPCGRGRVFVSLARNFFKRPYHFPLIPLGMNTEQFFILTKNRLWEDSFYLTQPLLTSRISLPHFSPEILAPANLLS